MANEIVVYLTPKATESEYGTEVDITDFVYMDTLSEIREFVDSEDFDFGIFAFGDIQLVCDNSDGHFNLAEDYRSIFLFGRSFSKVRIAFRSIAVTRETDGTVNTGTVTETNVFQGIILDDAARTETDTHRIEMRVLSTSSIINHVKVPVGGILDGDTAQTAIFNILNQTRITSLLTVLLSNINPSNNIVIDDGAHFDNLSVADAIAEIMLASNSVYMVNSSLNAIVGGRDANAILDALLFYGPFDEHGRENIITLQEFNNGEHRMFNSIKIGEIEASDIDFIDEYGLRQKQFDIDFITTPATLASIGTELLDEFKVPKLETEITVPIDQGISASLLQKASINYPLKMVPPEGSFLTTEGVDEYGVAVYPLITGSLEISPTIVWKIIEKRHDLAQFTTTFKLRQNGTTYDDGYSA